MPELLHPGVYVLEVPPSVRPIEGASTSTAGFIGVADKGPIPGTVLPGGRAAQPVLVTSFTDFERTFGSFRRDSFLAYSAQSFFDNGGRRLYVVRVAPPDAATASAALPLEVVGDHVARGIEAHTGNTGDAADPGAEPREEEKLSHPAEWWIGPDWFRRAASHSFTHTFLVSVKNRMASSPPSRPTPLCRMPPNGTRRSRNSQVLTHTVPQAIWSATRWARVTLRVHNDAARP